VLKLGRQAERQSDGAFPINIPLPDGRHRLDPSGVVKGWAVERAAGFLDALDETDYCLSAGGDLGIGCPGGTAQITGRTGNAGSKV
jgi:thiamine biosynthesis lipoprotein